MNSLAHELLPMLGARGMAPVSSLARANQRDCAANDPHERKTTGKDILALLATANTPLTTEKIASMAEISKAQATGLMMSLKKAGKITQSKTMIQKPVNNNGKTYQRSFTLSLWSIKREAVA